MIFFFAYKYQFIDVYRTATYHFIRRFFYKTISGKPKLFYERASLSLNVCISAFLQKKLITIYLHVTLITNGSCKYIVIPGKCLEMSSDQSGWIYIDPMVLAALSDILYQRGGYLLCPIQWLSVHQDQ